MQCVVMFNFLCIFWSLGALLLLILFFWRCKRPNVFRYIFKFWCIFWSPDAILFWVWSFEGEQELCLNSKATGLQSQNLHHWPFCVYWPLIHFTVDSTAPTHQQFALFRPLLLWDTHFCQSHPRISNLCCIHLLVTSNVHPYKNPSLY